jgi:hypothetical protein
MGPTLDFRGDGRKPFRQGFRQRLLDSWGYAQRSENLGNGKYKSYKMHRLISGLVHGDKRFVDHINRNKLDNRRSNLRILDSGFDGQQNLPSYKGSSSRYRGVSRNGHKWRAYCRIKGKLHSLGYYENEIEAAHVAENFRKENMIYSQRDLGL